MNKMPGFTAEKTLKENRDYSQIHGDGVETWAGKWSDMAEEATVMPAAGPGPACTWWQWMIFPVACGWIQMNIMTGTPGYGPSKCTLWQIPADPFGCAAL